MENKYYTPTIEEFHVGFEFESYADHCGDAMSGYYEGDCKDWSGEIFYNLHRSDFEGNGGMTIWSMKGLAEAIKDEDIQVKYLDVADIESLGFKLTGRSNTEDNVRGAYFNAVDKNCAYELKYSFGDKPYWLEQGPQVIIQAGGVPRLNAKVKNKSELKKVLKQIGYGE